MSKFLSTMGNGNFTKTENGAVTNKSSLSPLLDWFFHGPAMRSRPQDAIKLFQEAFTENPTQALRVLFYLRDIRGGQGERNIFRTIFRFLASSNSENAMSILIWLRDNLKFIPEYGRWDDLFPLIHNTTIGIDVTTYIYNQLQQDVTSSTPSLLAKWMPSENATSKLTIELAKFFYGRWNISAKKYRKLLSTIRKKLKLIETNLTNKDYTFNYSYVPSNAAMKYRKAFYRNDSERYKEYLASVAKGETKINASTLYPYDIIEKMRYGTYDGTLEAQWKALPDYVDDIQGLVVADTSGSMLGRPMAVSVSLAMYIAERNKCKAFKDYFISFSAQPKLHKIEGKTLLERMRSVQLGDVANTNIQGVFNCILQRGREYHVPQEDMPKILLIVSDMEFDRCHTNLTNFEVIRKKYKAFDYDIPTLVFWNVNSRNTQSPVTINDKGVILVGGCSPSVLKYALGKCTNLLEMVYQVTNSERYRQINFK